MKKLKRRLLIVANLPWLYGAWSAYQDFGGRQHFWKWVGW